MVSPSNEAALQDAPIEEIEFDAETKELDKLAEVANGAYPGKISRQNWAYEAISYLAKNIRPPLLPPGSGPLCHLPSIYCAPQKRPPSGRPARTRGLPGGTEPARLRQPSPIEGESRIAAHNRARLALAEFSQSL